MTENELRESLGIPIDAKQVMIFSQSSHLDWDWLENFTTLCSDDSAPYFHSNQEYVQKPAFMVFDEAVGLVLQYQAATPAYYYSVAEIGFLQAYAQSSARRQEDLQKCGTFLHLCGGGITSPDNLLPHGETFIRNFLVARQWIDATLPALPVQNLWIPDDFGHDSQLPVAAAAMDFLGAGFSRVPGGWPDGQGPLDKSPSIAEQLRKDGFDFVWRAADGSSLLAHWMSDTYWEGDRIDTGNDGVYSCWLNNKDSSPTGYMFLPLGVDFEPPRAQLLSYMDGWNQGSGTQSYRGTGAYAVAATFDTFVQFLTFHRDKVKTRAFDGVPYFFGFFASRPSNKIVHYQATRALLAAEALGAVADAAAGMRGGNADRLAAQQEAWAVLVPSTHHDYITGTSGTQYKDVNALEQLPRLELAGTLADGLREDAISQLAGSIAVNPPSPFAVPVVVCNPLGFPRSGIVSLPGGAGFGAQSAGSGDAVQQCADGSLLFRASAPSLGYTTAWLRTDVASSLPPGVTINQPAQDSWTLSNEFLSATVHKSLSLTSFKPVGSPMSILADNGNTLAFYNDNGAIYRYGNERTDTSMTPYLDPTFITTGPISVLEQGPLRVSVRTVTTLNRSGTNCVFEQTYTLVAGEPFLRMSISGSMPKNMSLFVRFPFYGLVTSLTRGTTCHWSDARTIPYWPDPTFYATHDWLLPVDANGQVFAAVYHDAVPSWGYDAQGALLGNVLRNSYGEDHYGARASDPGVHLQHYALRVPGGLGGPATGQPLREALQFTTPMLARPIAPPPLSSATMPETFSLASVTSPSSAIITAAKAADAAPSDLILRLYQPTNAGQRVSITTAVDATNARVQSALEKEFVNQPPNGSASNPAANGLTVQMDRALVTVRLPGVL